MKFCFLKRSLNKLVAIAIGLTLLQCSPTTATDGWKQLPGILEQIVAPEFPNVHFLVTDYGAIGDGEFNCGSAFKKAIQACHEQGGGHVVVPAGVFLTGAIHLKSNVNLHLEQDAIIRFSRDYDQYLPVVLTRFEGVECMNYSPFIYAFEQTHIAITGKGVLDGQADDHTWWYWALPDENGIQVQKTDRDMLFKMGEDSIPVEKRIFGKGHYIRPNFIQFYRCSNILVEDVSIRRSPMWEIHPVLSSNVTVRGVNIVSHGPNNDGCNPESCRDVLIEGCYFNTGDDCIAIKSGRNGDGRRVNVPSENIIIRDCSMKDGHGGVVIGSEISGGCRNVFAENCVMDSPNLERALRIKTNSSRGGLVENIHMRHIQIGEVSDAVLRVNFNYELGDIGQFTPVVRNVYMSHVSSEKSKFALFLDGYERSPITGIYLDSCTFNGVTDGNFINHARDLHMQDVTINGKIQ